MRIRVGILAIFAATLLFTLSGCGGGGGAILDTVHEGKFTSARAINLNEKQSSDFYKQLRKKFSGIHAEIQQTENYLFKLDLELPQIGQITSIGGMTHIVGPFNLDKMKEFYEEEENRDIEDKTEDGQTYYVDEKSNGAMAYMQVAGGILSSDKESIENTIRAMTKGKDRLADDDGFKEARQLVDFGATEYYVQWDEMDNVRREWKTLTQIEKDKDFEQALDKIDGIGKSSYWRGDFEYVVKLLFSKEDDAKEVEEVLRDNKKKILENHYGLIMPSFLNQYAKDRNEIKDLDDQVNIALAGKIIEIRVRFNWDDVEKIFE